jgi:hypothetical protein
MYFLGFLIFNETYSSLQQVNQAQVENFRFKIDITFILMNFFE